MHSNIILATGIPGAGVSTVLKGVKDVEFTYINFGDVMFDMGKDQDVVKDRDELRKQKIAVQKELQLLAAVEIKAMEGDLKIVDTHCTIKTPEGFYPGFPNSVIERLNPHAIIIVEAVPKDVLKHRNKDKSRKRDPDTLEQIAEHQLMNRMAAMSFASLLGIPVLIVQNEENKVGPAAEKLAQLMKNVVERWG